MDIEGKNVCLIIGSPKGINSTSSKIGHYILEGFRQKGASIATYTIEEINGQKNDELFQEIIKCSLVILSTPLYVDSLPATVIKMFEDISDYKRKSEKQFSKAILLGIVNSGFPESERCNSAIKSIEIFANKNDFLFAGGIPVGGGAILSNRDMDKIKGIMPNLFECLQCSVNDILNDNVLSKKTLTLASNSLIHDNKKEIAYIYINKMCE